MTNFGGKQVVGFNTQTDRDGINTVQYRDMNKTEGMYVFSPFGGSFDYDVTPGQEAIAGTDDITDIVAGAELEPIVMGDAFADFEVIPNPTELARAKAELDAITEAGGTVNRIAIESTATATGISPDGEETFINSMNSAGFPKYAEITNFAKDTDLGDFSEMEVTSADRALAVARGRYLAKQLGFNDDQVEYKFSLVKGVPGGGGKIVNLTVLSQGEDQEVVIQKGTPGQDAIPASAGETFTSTEVGALGKINRLHITFIKKRDAGLS